MFSKIHQTKEHNNSKKGNSVTYNLVKLTILVAAVLLQVGFRADAGLAAGRTTLVYNPASIQGGDDIINGQMKWTYDNATTSRPGFPIINVWNGGNYLEQRWTTFYTIDSMCGTGNTMCSSDSVCYNRKHTAGTYSVCHHAVIQRFNIINGKTVYVSDEKAPAKYALVTLSLDVGCSYGEEFPIYAYEEVQYFTYGYKYSEAY